MIGFLIFMGVGIALVYGVVFLLAVLLAWRRAPFAAARRIAVRRFVRRQRARFDGDKRLQQLYEKYFLVLLDIWMENRTELTKAVLQDGPWIPESANAMAGDPSLAGAGNRRAREVFVARWRECAVRLAGIISAGELAAGDPALPRGAWAEYLRVRLYEEAPELYRRQLLVCSDGDTLYHWLGDNYRMLRSAKSWLFTPLFAAYRQAHPEVVPARYAGFLSWFHDQLAIRYPDPVDRKLDLAPPLLP